MTAEAKRTGWLRSGDGPLSVRARPSSIKRDCDRRATSTGERCLVTYTRSHQRKKTFVKRYGKIIALIVVTLVAWGFLLRVMQVSARWRGQAI